MTDKKEIKKYCSGIDCLTCDEVEPCIYRIANKLQEQLERKEQEVKELNLVNKRLGAELCGKLQNYMRALDEIERYLDAQQKYFDGEDYHNLLDIINEARKY